MSDPNRIKRLAMARKIERETWERNRKARETLWRWVREAVAVDDEITLAAGVAIVLGVTDDGIIQTDMGAVTADDVLCINGVSLDELTDE